MIGYLHGIVLNIRDTYLTLLVRDVGYRVSMQKKSLASVSSNDEREIWVRTIAREDALDLYGFDTEVELDSFELLLSVSGIGPKSALAILDAVTIDTLRTAIAEENPQYLTAVSGIGKKTAEKIILDLKGKVIQLPSGTTDSDIDAIEALRSLGYSPAEAREALRAVPRTISGMQNRLREALRLATSLGSPL